MKILFLYLDAFRQIGGIEKFNKAFMKALDDISKDGETRLWRFTLIFYLNLAMCGIFGVINFDSHPVDKEKVKQI